jgi:hypothetical protein
MKNSETLIQQIKSKPESIEFQDVINHIDHFYHYTPTRFCNGPDNDCVISKTGENEGSCKIFSFALLHGLNENQTLNCFGKYYRDDVLNHSDATDHANIRTFMKHGWENIVFDGAALKDKT